MPPLHTRLPTTMCCTVDSLFVKPRVQRVFSESKNLTTPQQHVDYDSTPVRRCRPRRSTLLQTVHTAPPEPSAAVHMALQVERSPSHPRCVSPGVKPLSFGRLHFRFLSFASDLTEPCTEVRFTSLSLRVKTW